jgi:peptide/nickel transport system permease protein
MRRYIFIRTLHSLVALLVVSAVVFGLVRLTGDPATLIVGEGADRDTLEMVRERLGLNRPLIIQYGVFLLRAVKGDFGRSLENKRPVIELIVNRLPNSIKLVAVSMAFAFVIGIPLGVVAAVKKGYFLDRVARLIAGLGQAIPSFWIGIVLVLLFSVKLRLLPASGMGDWRSYILPGFCLSLLTLAAVIRLLRSSMLEVLDSEFIKMARIKGVSEAVVIWKHALRNSLLAVVSYAGMLSAILITGAVVIETVFAWPGFGRLCYDAIMVRDFPLTQGIILTVAFLLIVANLATDILYAYLDPRIRIQS